MCLSIALFGLRQSTTAPWGMTSKSKQGTSPTICSEADIFSLAQKLSLDPKLLYRAAHPNGCPTVFNKHRKKHEGRSREAHSSLNSPQKQNHRNVFRYTVWQLFVVEPTVLGIFTDHFMQLYMEYNTPKRCKIYSNSKNY